MSIYLLRHFVRLLNLRFYALKFFALKFTAFYRVVYYSTGLSQPSALFISQFNEKQSASLPLPVF